MALKGDRDGLVTDVRFVVASTVTAMEAGDMMVRSTAGSGSLLVGTRPTVARAANPSGYKPVGASLAELTTVDETLYHRNFHKYQVKTGEPVELAKKGVITTNCYVGSPTGGDLAYLSSSGKYTPTVHATGGTVATPLVGEFEGAPDEDGYVSIRLELPKT